MKKKKHNIITKKFILVLNVTVCTYIMYMKHFIVQITITS